MLVPSHNLAQSTANAIAHDSRPELSRSDDTDT
jgi:hypothetical protein